MDFIADNAVQLSAAFLVIVVVAALVVAGIAGFRLWRRVRAAQRRVTATAAELTALSEQLSDSLARMPERQAEIQASLDALSRRAAVLSVLTSSASQAADVLRAPLRYLGR